MIANIVCLAIGTRFRPAGCYDLAMPAAQTADRALTVGDEDGLTGFVRDVQLRIGIIVSGYERDRVRGLKEVPSKNRCSKKRYGSYAGSKQVTARDFLPGGLFGVLTHRVLLPRC